jgi:transcriptional regulator with XRE-family HTH domain
LKAPYLKYVRSVITGLSGRRLASMAGVDRRTVYRIEGGYDARPETLAALAGALGATVNDLTGERSASPETHVADLDQLATEKKTYGPGDALYDDDLIASRTEGEIAQLVLEKPEFRKLVNAELRVRDLIRRGIEHADRERRRLEAERQQDAG